MKDYNVKDWCKQALYSSSENFPLRTAQVAEKAENNTRSLFRKKFIALNIHFYERRQEVYKSRSTKRALLFPEF